MFYGVMKKLNYKPIKINIPNRLKVIIVSLTICFYTYFSNTGALADDLAVPEYTIKTAFLFNFGKYVDWPAATLSDKNNDTLYICVQGIDPFGDNLKALEGKSIGSHKVKIKNVDILKGDDPVQGCHILFISHSERDLLSEIYKKLEGHPVLTVTDMNDSSDSGAMINLIVIDDKVRFEINLESARRAGMEISSQLLKLATKVTE